MQEDARRLVFGEELAQVFFTLQNGSMVSNSESFLFTKFKREAMSRSVL